MTQASNISCRRRETIRGVVVPEQWDDQFRVTEVHIACEGEREVRVENLDRFPVLLSLSQTEAVFTGSVLRSDMGESIIVESFTPLGGA
ncbi:hypothetical protein GM415_05235 [Pseudodesulfovibrio cashew]|uniref:Uncharacterized protein n=1 Tax=Pseudodesulfovibrio cashew TaxID=2678688 RepID=A0A6I6JA52_9BACT|nr:hypothetical protein [Pseudodesulfovibrio cashew]QGY39545.1 hypothetical protein GM415_05235 [Pseudodesulfovibrio cashew]